MILDIYKDSLEYSLKDGEKLLKLGIMLLFSFLIIPIFMFLGYYYRVIKIAERGMINGEDDLPDFNDLIGMFVDGITFFIVKIIYLILPAMFFLILLFIGEGISKLNNLIGNSFILFSIAVFIVLSVIFYLVSIIAIVHMANNNGSIKEALNISEIFNIIRSIGGLKYIGFYIGLLIIEFVILTVAIVIFGLIYGVIGGVGVLLGTGFNSISFSVSSILLLLYFIVFTFLISPYLTILEARATGLIYNIRE